MTYAFDGTAAGQLLGISQMDDDSRSSTLNNWEHPSSDDGELDIDAAKVLLPFLAAFFILAFIGIATL